MIVERERIRQMKLIEELGKRRMLTVVKTVDFGIYLGTSEERVLLPKKEVPKGIEIGEKRRSGAGCALCGQVREIMCDYEGL